MSMAKKGSEHCIFYRECIAKNTLPASGFFHGKGYSDEHFIYSVLIKITMVLL